MSPSELEPLLRKLIGEQVSDLMLLTAVCMVIGLALATLLGSYLAKKGEHLAISEDVKRLSDQASAMTSAVETIKTEISQGAWVAQKQWERKRELYTDLLVSLFELRTNTLRAVDLDKALQTASEGQKLRIQTELTQLANDQPSLLKQLIRARAIAEVVLVPEITGILSEWGQALSGAGKTSEETYENLRKTAAAIERAHAAIVEVAKKDLGI